MKVFKKAAALTVACALCVSSGFLGYTAYAKTSDLSAKSNKVSVYTDHINATENFFGNYTYAQPATETYMPGDSIAGGTVDIDNQTGETMELWLYAQPTETDRYSSFLQANLSKLFFKASDSITAMKVKRLQKASEALVKQITLKVDYAKYDGATAPTADSAYTTLYEGKMSGEPSGGKTMLGEKAISLGKFSPGEKGRLRFSLVIPGDEITGNILTSVVGSAGEEETIENVTGANGGIAGMIDWVFVASATSDDGLMSHPVTPDTPVTPSTPTPTPPPPSPPEIPKTGDEAMPYVLAAIACAVGAFGIFAMTFRKGKQQDMAAV